MTMKPNEQPDLSELLEESQVRTRRFKHMAKSFANLVVGYMKPNDPRWERASGKCICDQCGLEYYDHPCILAISLHITCDGRLWHL